MSDLTRIRKEAEAHLDGLGDTADLVAGQLLHLGITGARGGCTTCPIAVYLVTRINGVAEAVVRAGYISLVLTSGWVVEFDTPAAVGAFIGNFDLGFYNDLAVAP